MSVLESGRPEDVGLRPERIEHARRLLARWVEEGQTPTAGALVARRGRIVLHEAFGQLGPDSKSPPLEKDSIFQIFSITKPMTATAAMILVEDGLLGLNRPLVEYLPEVCGEGADQILVHHLFTHTSGYNDDEIGELTRKRLQQLSDARQVEATQDPRLQGFLEIRWDAPLRKPPGEEMSYCNHNYLLLGELIRRVSGQSLDAFTRERIFEPLGMKDTAYVTPEHLEPRVVKWPEDSALVQFLTEGGLPPDWANSRDARDVPGAFGGVHSTLGDLAIFGQTFLNRGHYGGARILSPRTVAQMTRNQIPGIGTQFFTRFYKEASWGLGWMVQSNEKWMYFRSALLPIGVYDHSGAGLSSLLIDPFDELVIVYLEVAMRSTPDDEFITNLELFQNVIVSAIAD